MAAQTMFSMGSYPVGVPMVVEDPQGLNELPHSSLPAPQLVMLANVAAVTQEGGGCDGSMADEKEMMELKTVGCSYSDSEDENVIRYSYDKDRDLCIIEYPECPPGVRAVVVGEHERMEEEEEEEEEHRERQQEEEEEVNITDLSSPVVPLPAAGAQTTQLQISHLITRTAKKKKPFHCKPCNYQAECEQEFVDHLGTHKTMRVNHAEGKNGAPEGKEGGGASGPQDAKGGAAEGGGDVAKTESKGVIHCQRCGYNTNRYDHYIAHLKHHSKEGDDHRVFKCTLCPYTTVSQYHWRKHLRNHFPSKLYTCTQCCYFSDRKNNYVQHVRTHTGERPFRCAYCDYSSSQKTHLTRHMRTHSGERPFKCESCNYLAANQHEVTRHSRQVHNGPKPLVCPYCHYKTADRSNYKKHVELHLNPRQFLCPVCKYAASKKCNLQYHIKSRHPGCDIAIDVSKVKLRVKKIGIRIVNVSSTFEEDDYDDDDDVGMEDVEEEEEEEGGPESPDKQSRPINLSIRKGNRQNEPNPGGRTLMERAPIEVPDRCEVTPVKEKATKAKDKAEKKTTPPIEAPDRCEVTPVKEKATKAKDKAEKKTTPPIEVPDRCEVTPVKEKATKAKAEKKTTTPRQKKNQKMGEIAKENVRDGEVEMAAESPVNTKAKRRSKKQTAEKTQVQDKTTAAPDKTTPLQEKTTTTSLADKATGTESTEKDQVKREKSDPARGGTEKESAESGKEGEKETARPQKNKEQPRNESDGKENKTAKKPRNGGSKNTEKVTETAREAPQKQDSPAKNQAEKAGKVKAVKRKAVEALDLSTKTLAEAVSPTKAKRSKAKTVAKPPSSAGGSEKTSTTVEPCPPAVQNNQADEPAPVPTPVKPKKAKKTNKKTPEPQVAVVLPDVQEAPVGVETQRSPESKEDPGSELSSRASPPTAVPTPEDTGAERSSAGTEQNPPETHPAQKNTPTGTTSTPATPQKLPDKSQEKKQAVRRSSGEETPSPAEDGPPPTFRRPLAKPTTAGGSPGQRGKLPADTDEDEGVHSSHEGGSDISDSASEGSDDSGLNGAAPGAGKMPNDPETPTDEIPTPTELKSHMCVFCDRTFPMEVEYRRHLNRHLVNVYYMDTAAKTEK